MISPDRKMLVAPAPTAKAQNAVKAAGNQKVAAISLSPTNNKSTKSITTQHRRNVLPVFSNPMEFARTIVTEAVEELKAGDLRMEAFDEKKAFACFCEAEYGC